MKNSFWYWAADNFPAIALGFVAIVGFFQYRRDRKSRRRFH